jgi:hypothetical protein
LRARSEANSTKHVVASSGLVVGYDLPSHGRCFLVIDNRRKFDFHVGIPLSNVSRYRGDIVRLHYDNACAGRSIVPAANDFHTIASIGPLLWSHGDPLVENWQPLVLLDFPFAQELHGFSLRSMALAITFVRINYALKATVLMAAAVQS